MSNPMMLTSDTDASLKWYQTPPLWHIDAVGGRPPHHPLRTSGLQRVEVLATTSGWGRIGGSCRTGAGSAVARNSPANSASNGISPPPSIEPGSGVLAGWPVQPADARMAILPP